jgi:DNA modification methylase
MLRTLTKVGPAASGALAVTYRATASLKPDPRNARTHPKRQLEQIIASIREFGFTNPILLDPEGVVIAGHGRLLAAKAMGLVEVPTIELVGLTEAKRRALRLADNKIALNAGWDLDLLKVELGELSSLDIALDLTVTGFSTGELDLLLRPSEDPEDELIPPVPATARTQPGDIWRLGEHVIGCGDSRDPEFLRKVIGKGDLVDVAFLDPPYNVRISGHANAKGRHREFAMASGEMSEAAFRSFLEETLGAAAQVSRDGAVHFVCMDWRHMDDVSAVGGDVYGELLNLCIWNKSNAGMGSLYRSKHELVFVFKVGTAPHFNAVELGRHGRNRTNVWDYASVNSLAGSRREDLALHPTVKPTALVVDAIQDVTRRGDLVLDSFLGSGTSLIACERSGRRFRGLEIDPAYVDVAIERWSAMTGGAPECVERSNPA